MPRHEHNYYATIGPIEPLGTCTYYDAFPTSWCLRDAEEPTLKLCARHFWWVAERAIREGQIVRGDILE